MKFVAKEDVALPQKVLFEIMADFQMFERVAIRRGVEVTRSGSIAAADGLKWDCTFEFRGRDRTACVRLAEFSDPEKMVFLSPTLPWTTAWKLPFRRSRKNNHGFRSARSLNPRPSPRGSWSSR